MALPAGVVVSRASHVLGERVSTFKDAVAILARMVLAASPQSALDEIYGGTDEKGSGECPPSGALASRNYATRGRTEALGKASELRARLPRAAARQHHPAHC